LFPRGNARDAGDPLRASGELPGADRGGAASLSNVGRRAAGVLSEDHEAQSRRRRRQADHPARHFAPANYHLLVEEGVFNLSVDDAVAYSRPSVDVLFESAADAYGDKLVAVILTGANQDGARGVARVKKRGGFVVVQDPKTAEAPAMPEAAIAATRVDRILPLDRIGSFLVELCSPGR
jgi:glyoxylase-like metal-dependent hydrolase (beta-lactamase superfamily II)